MQPQSTEAVGEAIINTCEETLTSLRAVKGEDFANLVREGVNVKSLLSLHATLVMKLDDNIEAQSLASMLALLVATQSGHYLNLLQEKAKLEDYKEAVEWIDRIHENAHRIGNAAMKAQAGPDTLQ